MCFFRGLPRHPLAIVRRYRPPRINLPGECHRRSRFRALREGSAQRLLPSSARMHRARMNVRTCPDGSGPCARFRYGADHCADDRRSWNVAGRFRIGLDTLVPVHWAAPIVVIVVSVSGRRVQAIGRIAGKVVSGGGRFHRRAPAPGSPRAAGTAQSRLTTSSTALLRTTCRTVICSAS